MKKLLIVLLCFYIGNVGALEYSEYTAFSDYTDKEILGDGFTDVKVLRKYKYYKFVREDGPYESESVYNDEYPYIDKDDYIYTLESNYLDEKPVDVQGRIITSHILYHHLKADDITYVKLYNSSFVDLNYFNFNVVYKGNSIDYDIIYENADSSLIKAFGEVELRFAEKIDLRYLNIIFDMKPIVSNRADLYIRLGNDRLNVGQARYIFFNDMMRNINFEGINTDTNSEAFVDYYSDEILETKPTIYYHDKAVKYTYKDILYQKYKLVREYSDDYLDHSIDDYVYKDEEKYKDYYAYRTRKILKNNFDENKMIPIIENKNVGDEGKKYGNVVYKILNDSFEKQNQKLDGEPVLSSLSNLKSKKNPICGVSEIKDESIIIYYFSYILIVIVILILVLSKLYKKYVKRVKV